MSQPVPPPIPPPIPKKNRTVLNIVLILAACVAVFILAQFAIAAVLGFSMSSFVSKQLKEMSELAITSAGDKFYVTVLEVKSEPGHFMERVRVRCDGDMKASLWVTDLKAAGIFEINRPDGKIIYREGDPHKAGCMIPVHASGGFSECNVVFKVTTTTNGTIWHEEIAGATLDTTLGDSMTISGVETNWPDAYASDMAIPLANLGNYKILLSVK